MKPSTHYELAIRDPASIYHTPQAVLRDASLNSKQKLAILQSWEQDQRELDVAQEEGMLGDEQSLLEDILAAMDKLDVPVTAQAAPTKQGSHST